MTPLWTSAEIAAATGGTASAPFEVTGVTFDSREVQPGDLFVAMPGTVYDGHKFVEGAFAAGAAGAIVSHPVDGPHVLVEDTARALEDLGSASRERSADAGRVTPSRASAMKRAPRRKPVAMSRRVYRSAGPVPADARVLA